MEETGPDIEITMTSRDAVKRLVREAVFSRWKLYALSVVCMVGVAGFTGLLAWSTKLIVNDVFVAGEPTNAKWVAALVVGISIGMAGFQYANAVVAVRFRRQISAAYQRLVFRELLKKNVPFFGGQHAAQHMARVMLYGRSSSAVAVSLTNKLLTDSLTLIALLAVMVWQDPMMSLMSLILLPAIGLIVTRLTKRIRNIAATEGALTGALHAVGAEAIEGIKTVKSYGLEDKTNAKFSDAVAGLENRMMEIARATSLTVPLMQGLGGVAIGLFVLYASWQTLSMGKTPGEFTAFITAFLLAYQPAERVSKVFVDIQKSLIHVERMFSLLDQPDDMGVAGHETLEGRPARLRFDGVSFAYNATAPALHDVSFEIEPGERIAIVGRSGAGKTTLIDLVQRFYAPTQGRVMIGDMDLTALAAGEVQRNVALISQDVFLFDGTIAENIRDGNPNATDAEVERAAAQAAVTGFAAEMKLGLDSSIGPNGGNLSGGQKQRVGIARALNKNAKVYIYDEATSALDGENEAAIMAAVVEHAPDSVVLFVTHRASTLKWVDRVMLMDAGQIVAFDTPEALERDNPNYRTLFDLENEPLVAE